jgi:hypothetical protein
VAAVGGQALTAFGPGAKNSPATIDRRLRPKKRQLKKRLYGRTKPGTLLKHHIPIKTDSWDVQINRLFGFVRQVRTSILHLGDLGIRILGMGPVVVRTLFFRFRSRRARSSRVGVSIPEAFASWVRNSW